MELTPENFNILIFLKDTYPISFIGIILTSFGYTLGALAYRHHIKTLNDVIIKTQHQILERLH